jgi:hypothetical protein
MTVQHVDEYLSHKAREGWCRSSLLTVANSLRSFLRYAEQQHWCVPGVAAAIVAPRLYQQERLTQGPDWGSVQELVKSSCGTGVQDIRDYAILMLLAIYAIRTPANVSARPPGNIAALCVLVRSINRRRLTKTPTPRLWRRQTQSSMIHEEQA